MSKPLAQDRLDKKVAIRQRALARHAKRRAEHDAFGKLLLHRMQVIRARMTAHGLGVVSWLGPSMLALVPLARWLGKPHEAHVLRHCTQELHKPYVAAALANPTNTRSESDLIKNPPVRLRFREASAYGCLGECMEATKSKSWGPLISIDPVEPTFPLSNVFVQYVFHAESRYNRRFEQRKYLKRKLGKAWRRLIGLAMSDTKGDFLKTCSADARAAIMRRLRLSPGEFWRAVKGKIFVARPPEFVQLELFDLGEPVLMQATKV